MSLLDRAIDELPEEQREVIRLLFSTTDDNTERTPEQVAEIIGTDVATMHRLKNKGLRTIRARLARARTILERMARR
jgi:DNA-directed RNA polymerase specialized sigma24 family protein